jgi:uncharacterized protein
VKIDLANIAGVPGAHGRYPIRERLDPIDGTKVTGPVTGELTVQNIGRLLVVRGHLHALIEMPCTRCLRPTRERLEVTVEEEFASAGAPPDVGTIDVEDPERSAIEDFVLDGTEFVRQQVETQLPMTALCRPDCQGLCPRCGSNLNEGPCQCGPEDDTGPFAQLKELLDEEPDRE